MGLIVKNLAGVLKSFARQESKVQKGSLLALREAANLVVMAAKLNAPVDEGDLEGAISAIEERNRTSLGRFGVTVIKVGVDTSKLDLGSRNGYDYSIRMHEDPDYKLGPLSEAKQATLGGVTVGYKYLERALKDNERLARQRMEAIIKRSVGR